MNSFDVNNKNPSLVVDDEVVNSSSPSSSDFLLPGFEGPEKKLEIDFVPVDGSTKLLPNWLHHKCSTKGACADQCGCGVDTRGLGLRAVSRDRWAQFLELAHCEIISSLSNAHCDSFVLSESSLFVYPLKVVLKTCGTTTLLCVIDELLALACGLDLHPDQCFFSRKNYVYPEHQRGPHRSFADEVKFLNDRFHFGAGYVMGPRSADHWFLYVANCQPLVSTANGRDTSNSSADGSSPDESRSPSAGTDVDQDNDPASGRDSDADATADQQDDDADELVVEIAAETAVDDPSVVIYYLNDVKFQPPRRPLRHHSGQTTDDVGAASPAPGNPAVITGGSGGAGHRKDESRNLIRCVSSRRPAADQLMPCTCDDDVSCLLHQRRAALPVSKAVSPPPTLAAANRSDVTLEIMMHELDPAIMRQFYRSDTATTAATDQSVFQGIARLMPGALIDEHLFDPCGYSMNGLYGSSYFTIHVTPEPHCSFVSFETNLPGNCLPDQSYQRLIHDVVSLFKPGSFSVTLFSDFAAHQPGHTSSVHIGHKLPGFTRLSKAFHDFVDYNVTFCLYESL